MASPIVNLYPCQRNMTAVVGSRAAIAQSRRRFLSGTASGLGAIALGTLLQEESCGAARHSGTGSLGGTHFPARAKRVIYLFQSGGPSHLDTFDYKPHLKQVDGSDVPPSVLGTQRVTLMTRSQARFPAFGSPFVFRQYGQSGQWFSELLPHLASVSDHLCLIKSMQTEPINHDPAMMFVQTGRGVAGLPAMGCWLHYGLGSECADLPAYVVMTSGPVDQPILSRYWQSGFLPARYQGVQFQSSGDPVLFLSNPAGIDHHNRGRIIQGINRMNRLKHEQVGDPQIEARIDAYEMAYRMQVSVPELTDFSDEPGHVLELYGPEVRNQGSFAYQCLLARRLAERGVRFVQLFHAGWDHHGGLREGMERQCRSTDQPSAGLIRDLAQRGMLEDTLVVWGGEFGRTAYTQGSNGRDHHPRCFTVAVAGGGFRGGVSYGETDDYGYNIVRDVVHVRDLHATMLQQLGIDHQRFTYPFQGLDARLTGVEEARIVRELLV